MEENKCYYRALFISLFAFMLLSGKATALTCGEELQVMKQVAVKYKLNASGLALLRAIRKTENGKPGREFGILRKEAKTYRQQAEWCAGTIRNNYYRWKRSGGKQDYLSFLAGKYAPIGCANDPKGLNKNWKRNVEHWYRKLI